MNHRERVFAALSHREPDRVPRTASLTPAVLEEFRKQTGQNSPADYWDWDFAHVGFKLPNPLPNLVDRFGRFFAGLEYEWILDWKVADYPPEWGVATRPAHLYHLAAPLPPMARMADVKELEEYPFPDYLGEWRHDHLEAEVQRLKNAGYPVAAGVGWIFQTAWTLRGRERLFIDFYDNPEFAKVLLDRITAIRKAQAIRLAEAGVDMISLSDDVGIQQSMMISPSMWRRWLKPRMRELIETIHRVNPGIYFRYHSDGLLTPIIPELIEIGVSSLITVQPESMDVFEIKRRFGADICMEGTIGCQSELMLGTPAQVRQIVKEQCEGLMPGGGFIASSANGITPDIPWENLVALFDALEDFGYYS